MDFYSAYRHDYVRVAACTHHTTLADPSANARSVLRMAVECHDDGVALAVFPELTLCGYSIEDILLQDTLLDAVVDAHEAMGARPSVVDHAEQAVGLGVVGSRDHGHHPDPRVAGRLGEGRDVADVGRPGQGPLDEEELVERAGRPDRVHALRMRPRRAPVLGEADAGLPVGDRHDPRG